MNEKLTGFAGRAYLSDTGRLKMRLCSIKRACRTSMSDHRPISVGCTACARGCLRETSFGYFRRRFVCRKHGSCDTAGARRAPLRDASGGGNGKATRCFCLLFPVSRLLTPSPPAPLPQAGEGRILPPAQGRFRPLSHLWERARRAGRGSGDSANQLDAYRQTMTPIAFLHASPSPPTPLPQAGEGRISARGRS